MALSQSSDVTGLEVLNRKFGLRSLWLCSPILLLRNNINILVNENYPSIQSLVYTNVNESFYI